MLRRTTDDQGGTVTARICRIESDLPGTGTLETNLIMHALSAGGGKVETITVFTLDDSLLDSEDYLG
ncbi:hypothetical protein ACIXOA_08445 [Bacteroides fragilis]